MEPKELVISEFTGEIQKRILDRMNSEYLSTGKFVKDQMSVSPKVWSSLMLSGGAAGAAASSAMSSKLYMATAPITSLMKLSSGGVGSAVMGPKGIVRHAGFVSAGVGSSFPVVAPLMAMQALSTVVMLQQFSAMDKKLDAIKGSIDKMLARQEVTKVAELFTALHIVDEIYAQYGRTGRFSIDMLIRLALAEHDAMSLSRRYEMLENSRSNDAAQGFDTYCTMLASFLNLRVKYLRTCVDVQENPQFVQRSSENFAALLKDNIILWDTLLHKSEKIKDDVRESEAQLENANVFQKITQAPKAKELLRKKEAYHAALENERTIMQDFLILIDIAKQMSEVTDTQTLPTVLYWHDSEGEHCIATNEQALFAV